MAAGSGVGRQLIRDPKHRHLRSVTSSPPPRLRRQAASPSRPYRRSTCWLAPPRPALGMGPFAWLRVFGLLLPDLLLSLAQAVHVRLKAGPPAGAGGDFGRQRRHGRHRRTRREPPAAAAPAAAARARQAAAAPRRRQRWRRPGGTAGRGGAGGSVGRKHGRHAGTGGGGATAGTGARRPADADRWQHRRHAAAPAAARPAPAPRGPAGSPRPATAGRPARRRAAPTFPFPQHRASSSCIFPPDLQRQRHGDGLGRLQDGADRRRRHRRLDARHPARRRQRHRLRRDLRTGCCSPST